MRRALHLHHDADVRGGFVAQVANALKLLLLHQVLDARDEFALVHAIRDRGDDDATAFTSSRLPAGRQVINNLRLPSHDDRTLAAPVRVLDVRLIERDTPEREIGTFDELEEVV